MIIVPNHRLNPNIDIIYSVSNVEDREGLEQIIDRIDYLPSSVITDNKHSILVALVRNPCLPVLILNYLKHIQTIVMLLANPTISLTGQHYEYTNGRVRSVSVHEAVEMVEWELKNEDGVAIRMLTDCVYELLSDPLIRKV